MMQKERNIRRVAAAAVALLVAAVLPTVEAETPSDSVLRDFEPSSDFILVLADGSTPKADIFRSRRAGAMLILSSALPAPVLISPRKRAVEKVGVMSLAKRANGNIDLLADARPKRAGDFTLDGSEIRFSVDGVSAKLAPRPALLGAQTAQGLLDYSPSYGQGKASYTPDAKVLAGLKSVDDEVRVKVFFGSWCGFCKQYVPYVLKVEEQLAGSNVKFEYYGLPQGQGFSEEPEAKRYDIGGVPTGVVFVDGKEVGRISSDGWKKPEVTLQGLVRKAG